MGEYDKYIQSVKSAKGYDGFPSLKFLDTSGVDTNAAAVDSETVDATAVKNNTKTQPFDYSKYYNKTAFDYSKYYNKTDYGDYSKYYNASISSNNGNYSKYSTKTLSLQQVSPGPGINLDSSEVPADQFNKGKYSSLKILVNFKGELNPNNNTASFNLLVTFLIVSVLVILLLLAASLYHNYQKKYDFLNEELEINNTTKAHMEAEYILLDTIELNGEKLD